jgi:hypothetical protein
MIFGTDTKQRVAGALAMTAADICRCSTADLDCLQGGGRCRLVDLDAAPAALIAR